MHKLEARAGRLFSIESNYGSASARRRARQIIPYPFIEVARHARPTSEHHILELHRTDVLVSEATGSLYDISRSSSSSEIEKPARWSSIDLKKIVLQHDALPFL